MKRQDFELTEPLVEDFLSHRKPAGLPEDLTCWHCRKGFGDSDMVTKATLGQSGPWIHARCSVFMNPGTGGTRG